jgi:uncharacterized protein YoaH (UPF0181 family)
MVSVANQEKKQERTTAEPQVSAIGEFSICQHALAEFLGDATSALLLQRLHYWLQNEYSGYLLGDGIKRVYLGYKEIKEQFRWLSIYQIGRHIRLLEEVGWLKSDRFHNLNRNIGFITKAPHFQEDNQRKWYYLDYQRIFEDTEVDLLFGKEPHKSPKRRHRANVQNCRLQSANSHNAICEIAQSSIYKEKPNQNQISLSQESENQFFELSKELEVSITEEIKEQGQLDLPSFSEVKAEPRKSQDQQNSGEGQFSAAAPVKILERSYNVNHARPNYHLNGFESQEEKDGFYQALLELGKQKAEVRSPVGWVCNIIKDINAGGTCEYLNEYRRGEPLGMCEKQEWENAPGEPYPRFLTFLRRRLKTNQMSSEQAIAAVHKALRDTNQAKELWESFKRTAVNFADQWERDKALGLSSAYVPPELLPDAEVAIEEAAQAMSALQEGSVQVQSRALPDAPQPAIEPAAAVVEPEPSLEEKVTVWQKMWNAPNAELFGRKMVRKFVLETPGVILTDDGPVLETVVKPIPVEEETLKVGDRVFVNSHPHTDRLGPYSIEWIDGAMAKLENFRNPVPSKELRRGD